MRPALRAILLRAWLVAVIWPALLATAFAQEAAAGGDQSFGGLLQRWALAYVLVALCIALGLMAAAKPSSRKEIVQQGYVQTGPTHSVKKHDQTLRT